LFHLLWKIHETALRLVKGKEGKRNFKSSSSAHQAPPSVKIAMNKEQKK
jgi:hypothetical protein